jgi:hypothetical protein
MNKVIGPIKKEHWITLLMLKESIEDYKKRDINKYKVAIEKESIIYRDILNDYIKVA